MRSQVKALAVVVALLASPVAVCATPTQSNAPTAADQMLLAPDAKVAGESFGTLTARWWQWASAQEIAPYLDPDGRLCELGQEGPVWFLAGTSGDFTAQRECVIPLDRHILVPVINMRDSNRRKGDRSYLPVPCEVLQKSAAVNNEQLGSAIVLIDGVPVTDVARFRVRSDGCFPLLADDPDSQLTAADGYWLLLKPLPPGRHTLTVGANYAAERSNGYGRMVQNFEYVLYVGGKTDMASTKPVDAALALAAH